MLATGLGGPISVSKSSIHKAQTILENYNTGSDYFFFIIYRHFRKHEECISYNSLSALLDEVHGDIPMFATGSGRPVSVKKSSLQKAAAVLDSHSGKLTCFFLTTGSIS